MSVDVEFWRGPLDGATWTIPDGSKLWIVRAPRGDIKEFHVPQDDPTPTTVYAVDEHAYVITERFGTTSHLRIFEYIGERVKK